MNVNLQKYAPPCAVLTIALYLGWPPETPLDLGEDVVRAKSVRWKVADLETPTLPAMISKDPFAAVLVQPPSADASEGDPSDATPDEPTGPTDEDLRNGLRLGGIARTDHHRWAIVNGSVCKPGDQVPVLGLVDVSATIREIAANHVTVVSGPVTIQIKREERPKRSADPSVKPATPATGKTGAGSQDANEDEDAEDAPRPTATAPDRPENQPDPRENRFQARL